VTDSEALAAAAHMVGVPWLPKGEDPAVGWNCWGCVRYGRRQIFGLESPSWAQDYTSADVASRERVEELIAARMGGWEETEIRPGAVLLFRTFGRDCHVGLVLTRSDFIHTFGGTETTILRLNDPHWARRIRGAYDTRRQDRGLYQPGAVLSPA
jgi:cell wall-associated NlpC family hydrolase